LETIRRFEELRPGIVSVATVGVFDGVHLGHQAIMRAVKAAASARGARSAVVTFDRDPEELVSPEGSAAYITTLRQKLALIAEQDMDLAVVMPLERRLVDMPAEQFVSEVLCGKLSVVHVVVGTNFVFGKGRSGGVKLLREMGQEIGFEVTAVSPVKVGGVSVSSTAIRRLISDGKIEKANELLGHPYALAGRVVPGDGIGRSLGYPTANVRPVEKQVLPARGVYAVSVRLDEMSWAGVANLGVRPTVGSREMSVEVYIVGFSGDIYGQELEVAFHSRLRGEIHFPNTEALKRQINLDVERALQLVE